MPTHGDRFRTLPSLRFSLLLLGVCAGCTAGAAQPGQPEVVWGRRGQSEGRLLKPRAMAIDRDDNLYIVDMTARIQVFTRDGEFLRGWRTPDFANGKPVGLEFDRKGNLLVADTHYFRVLTYTPLGERLTEQTIGGVAGQEPGQFGFVTDCVQDSRGNYYVAEYGEHDRIQKFSPDRQFLFQWGSHGREPGHFMRPQDLALDEQDHLWVADACNHRVQVFDATGGAAKLLQVWGEEGERPGQLRYPYDLLLDDHGHVYVAEFGNHRVQKFTRDGRSLGVWGCNGRGPGELDQPWALVMDSRRCIHVLDTYNHRVQRIKF
jgi:sugar lactone lactonase YvrE